MSPPLDGAGDDHARPRRSRGSAPGETTCDLRAPSVSPPPCELVGLGPGGLGATDVEERLLGQVVEVAVDERLERVDRLLDRGGDAGQAGEDLGHVHRLGQEPLHLAGPGRR